jgi:hypothetical protein
MTWKRKRPVVKLITDTYETGIKLTSKAMALVETHTKLHSDVKSS